jgi:hypothetical protein
MVKIIGLQLAGQIVSIKTAGISQSNSGYSKSGCSYAAIAENRNEQERVVGCEDGKA